MDRGNRLFITAYPRNFKTDYGPLTMWMNQFEVLQHLLGGPLIAVFYITLIALLIQKGTWKRLLSPLSSVGRMAFTNYIMQSVICTLIFFTAMDLAYLVR